ncbi:MAG: hypothetical protein ABI624_06590 [Casimicrobiaceae bacterium]
MVTKLFKTGRLVMVGDRVNVEASIAKLAEGRDPARGGKNGKSDGIPSGAKVAAGAESGTAPAGRDDSYNAVRTTRESFNAKEAELDYLERVGALVERERYDRALVDALAPVMAALDRMAPTLGPLVTGETDARKVQNLIDDAVDGIRRDMEATIRAMLAGPGTRQ